MTRTSARRRTLGACLRSGAQRTFLYAFAPVLSVHPRLRQPAKPLAADRARGFTILELLIASGVFAVILLVVAVGVIRFSNDYYRGVTASKTQSTARAIMLQVSQSIEFGKTVTPGLTGAGGVKGVCIDNTLYSYALGQQVTDTSPQPPKHQGFHGLVLSSPGACASGVTPTVPNTAALSSGSRELLGQHMRLSALDVTPQGSLYLVHIRVIYGDDDLLNPSTLPGIGSAAWVNEGCAGGPGSQFCSVSDLTTTVERRLL